MKQPMVLSLWMFRVCHMPNAKYRYFIEKLIGQGVNDGVPLNPVLVSIFFLMGCYPVILACLGIPSMRSANKVQHSTPHPWRTVSLKLLAFPQKAYS